jgi:formylglycine-generating enzyme required for sulfatase activity
MGSPDGEGERDEHPQTEVTLSAYCFDRTEVTAGAYAACVRAGKCTVPVGGPYYAAYGIAGREQYPVNYVDWNQASAYCAWTGGRLPTEAEWEYAARGPDGRRYPWGDAEPAGVPWYPNAALSATVPRTAVGSNPWGRSWVGAEDLAGSMWEWVSDTYGSYPGGAVTNPRGAARGDRRVIRGGGSGLDQRAWMRGAIRTWNTPNHHSDYVGFRCARR